MSSRGMAFAASRAERPLPVVENSGGGHDLTRYIRPEQHRVPGYTGHVPGRKIEAPGIGQTYGNVTAHLLNPEADSSMSFTIPANPTDFRQTLNKGIGPYVRPGDDPEDVYKTLTSKTMARGASHLTYREREKKTIPGYMGFIPDTRMHIGGPGEQYWSKEDGTMDGDASMSRTEYRDTTGLMPKAYDKPWLQNATPKDAVEIATLEDAFRPKAEHGAQDPWPQGPAPLVLSNASLAMGPRTADVAGQYPTDRGFKLSTGMAIAYGRRADLATTTIGGSDPKEVLRVEHMNFKETAHGHPGNVVTSLTTTGGKYV